MIPLMKKQQPPTYVCMYMQRGVYSFVYMYMCMFDYDHKNKGKRMGVIIVIECGSKWTMKEVGENPKKIKRNQLYYKT